MPSLAIPGASGRSPSASCRAVQGDGGDASGPVSKAPRLAGDHRASRERPLLVSELRTDDPEGVVRQAFGSDWPPNIDALVE